VRKCRYSSGPRRPSYWTGGLGQIRAQTSREEGRGNLGRRRLSKTGEGGNSITLYWSAKEPWVK